MLIDKINTEIAKLEDMDTTYSNCEKLAYLYIVRDHLTDKAPTMTRSIGDTSDFLRATEGKSTADILSVMDELMETLKVVNEKVYNSVMLKIQRI
jgi:hypothetical protein